MNIKKAIYSPLGHILSGCATASINIEVFFGGTFNGFQIGFGRR
jgi:hypothetical protein